MRLPNPVLVDIVQGLGREAGATAHTPVDGGAAPGPERRGERRRRLESELAVTRYGAIHRSARPLQLFDLSPRGVGLVLRDFAVAPGEQIVVHVPRATGATLDVLCTVRSVRVLRDGRFRAGAEFSTADEPTATDHVASVRSTVGGSIRVGDAAPKRVDCRALWGNTANRRDLDAAGRERRDERVPLGGRAMMYVCHPDGTAAPEEGVYVGDLSAGGVGIGRGNPLEVGEQFMIRVPRVDERPVSRLCAVTRAQASGDRFTIGARFIPFTNRRGRGWLARVCDWV